MRFTCTIEVNAPISKVAQLFDNKNKLKEWQDGFVSYEPVSGKPGTKGAIARVNYKTGKNTFALTETILVKNMPNEITALYEHKHMTNTMSNIFTALNAGKTRLETEIHYTKFNGFVPRLMASLMPGMFKKQTQKWLDSFKVFAEKELK